MRLPLVISFYTKNTLYEREVENLAESCERQGIAYDIEGIESLGRWELNCGYKPFFIAKKMKEHARPLLWVDADGVFVQPLDELPFLGADFAARIHPELPLNHPSRLISSTLYVNSTDAAKEIVESWAKRTRQELADPNRKVEFWDQTTLRDTLDAYQGPGKVAILPIRYLHIAGHPLDSQDPEPPIILHFQASRRANKAE